MPEYDPHIDYYEVLQVHPRATSAVVRSAYRVILRELGAHPDLGGREDFAALLNRAYRVLSDPELRAEYDGARLLAAPRGEERIEVEQILACPSCGRSNRLALGRDARRTPCSYCGAYLHAPAASVQPERTENVFGLPSEEYQRLCEESQLDRRPDTAASGEALRCRFCGNEWTATRPGRPLRLCPTCGRRDWQAFRLLKCRVCGHEWRSGLVGSWAYRDHPRCPSCSAERWNSYCASHPLRWFLGLLHR